MNLDDLRSQIDGLDEQIINLLNQRTECAREIGQRKKEHSANVYVPGREKIVFDKVVGLNQGPLTERNIRAIYREIMSASISLESDVKIAFLGPLSTWSHQAAMSRFGGSVEYLPCKTFGDVFDAVEKEQAEYGVVPLENSIEGGVTQVQDLLRQTSLKIYAELYENVAHALVGNCPPEQMTRIYSHPQAIAQCRRWLELNVPNAELVSVSSTGRAAEIVTEEDHVGAVGSPMAAEIYGLQVCQENIQDVVGNATRFVVLSTNSGPPTESDKSSLYFGIQHKAGALYRVLSIFEDAGINLLRIESRPSKSKQWEYHFFVDFQGHAEDPEIQTALAQMANECTMLSVLGSYPKVDPAS